MPTTRRHHLLHGADSYQDSRRVDDIETGTLGPNRARFRDVVNATINRKRCQDIKKQLLAAPGRHTFEKFRMSNDELKTIKNKQVRRFYEKQNEKLDDWLEIDTLVLALADDVLDSMHPEDLDHDGVHERGGPLRDTNESIEPFLPQEERDKRIKSRRRSRWAININVVANILLLIAKCVAIVYSDSLSLLASLVDSALDLLCTLIVWSTNKLVNWRLHKLKRKFPVGRKRLEPIGILVFSVIMVISFLQVAKESIEKLMPHLPTSADPLPTVAVASMAATIGLKGIIWFGCMPIKSSQVQALAQDCKTDVFFNTLSLLFPLIGAHLPYPVGPCLDPVGALLLSLFIIYDWGHTCVATILALTGIEASERTWTRALYLAYRFSVVEAVNGFKSIRSYRAGDGAWVEVDMMMNEDEKVRTAHDVAETLQYCLEGLGEVDRAFVTVDYMEQGPAGHSLEST
jgi:divalent metal cation (Fe/Co/Zn/Cd) transporter